MSVAEARRRREAMEAERSRKRTDRAIALTLYLLFVACLVGLLCGIGVA